MTKFAFTRRMTVETAVMIEAENEQDAWSRVLAGEEVSTGEDRILRLPTFRRTPSRDEYDL